MLLLLCLLWGRLLLGWLLEVLHNQLRLRGRALA